MDLDLPSFSSIGVFAQLASPNPIPPLFSFPRILQLAMNAINGTPCTVNSFLTDLLFGWAAGPSDATPVAEAPKFAQGLVPFSTVS